MDECDITSEMFLFLFVYQKFLSISYNNFVMKYFMCVRMYVIYSHLMKGYTLFHNYIFTDMIFFHFCVKMYDFLYIR